MKVIVTGIGKTGTTGLATMLANGLKLRYVHEPKAKVAYQKLWSLSSGVVKINIYYIKDQLFGSFDKKVLLHRDPRDRFISALLFNTRAIEDQERLATIVQLLKEKEEDPKSHSVISLYRAFYPPYVPVFSPEQHITLYDDMINFAKAHSDYYQFKYEDWIDDDLESLESYLGQPVAGASKRVTGPQQIVTRTKQYGDWKNWFLPEDVEHFKPMFDPYMKFCGYEGWELSDERKIQPEFASQYVRRIRR